jgi:hypothetical protein
VVWVLWDPELDFGFQISTLDFFARAPDHFPDPDAEVQDWFAQAGEADTPLLAWAMNAWFQVKHAPTIVREQIIKETRELRHAIDEPGGSGDPGFAF